MSIDAILERLKAYQARLLQKSWLILLLMGIGGGIMLLESLARPDVLIANTVFHPEVNKQSAGLRENPFSFLIGSGAEGGETSFMIGILQSRNISEAVTSDSILFEGEKHLVADLILKDNPPYAHLMGLILYWIKGPPGEYSYNTKIVYSARQIRTSMQVEKTKEGFIDMQIAAYSPGMAELISNCYIEKLKAYYKHQRTEKAKNNVAFFTHRMDSLKTVLDGVNRRLAYYADRNQSRIYAQDELYPADLASEQAIVQQMYVTVVLSREQSLAQLQQDTPVIQVLDSPKPPHTTLSSSSILYIVLGIILGLMIGLVLVTRKMISADVGAIIATQLEQLRAKSAESEAAGEDLAQDEA